MATTTTVETTQRGTEEMARKCGKCGQVAPCRAVVSRTVNGIPTGTTYKHQCGGCGRDFSVISTWNIITHALGALFLMGICAFYAISVLDGPASRHDGANQPLMYVAAGFAASLLYAAWIVWKSLASSRNPLLGRQG